MEQLFLNDPTLWVLVSFVLFTALAFFLGRKSVTGMLDDKIDSIRVRITEAEFLKFQAEQLLADYQARMAGASQEADAIIAKAKAQAEDYGKQADASLAESMARREKMLKSRIEQMERAAIDDIRRYAAELAVSATTEIISQKLSSADASFLTGQSIERIAGKSN